MGCVRLFSRLRLLLLLLSVVSPIWAHGIDSLSQEKRLIPRGVSNHKFYQITDMALPLMIVGAATYNSETGFRDLRNKYTPHFHYKYDDYLQYAPAALMLGLKIGGVEGRSSWGRMLTADAFSAALMAITVNSLKYTVRKRRPDGSQRNSFPSGHTATAFMTATMLHKEYGLTQSPWYSVAGYSLATVTAVSRQLNNRHWLSDVLFGAGLGILSTELGYYFADLIFKDKGIKHANLPLSKWSPEIKPSFLSYGVGYAINNKSIRLTPALQLRSKGGSTVSLEGAWFWNHHWGIGGRIGLQATPISIDRSLYLLTNPTFQEKNSLVGDPMGILFAGIGPYFSYPILPQLLIGARCLLTALHASSYGVYSQDNLSLEEHNLIKIGASTGIGSDIGIHLHKIVNDHFGFKLNCSYLLGGIKVRGKISEKAAQSTTYRPIRSSTTVHSFEIGASANILF